MCKRHDIFRTIRSQTNISSIFYLELTRLPIEDSTTLTAQQTLIGIIVALSR